MSLSTAYLEIAGNNHSFIGASNKDVVLYTTDPNKRIVFAAGLNDTAAVVIGNKDLLLPAGGDIVLQSNATIRCGTNTVVLSDTFNAVITQVQDQIHAIDIESILNNLETTYVPTQTYCNELISIQQDIQAIIQEDLVSFETYCNDISIIQNEIDNLYEQSVSLSSFCNELNTQKNDTNSQFAFVGSSLITLSNTLHGIIEDPNFKNLNVNNDLFMTLEEPIGTLSDRRLKTDLQVIADPLTKVRAITGYTFKRIDKHSDTKHTGVIAQDVMSVLPEAVYTSRYNSTEMYSVTYGNMIGLVIEAIKALDDKINYITESTSKSANA